MSATRFPDTVPAPQVQPPAAPRRMGNLRSMVISTVVVLVAVLAWVAMVPRVREVSRPAVDVTSVARQVRQETSWGISQPQLPAGWKATNVRFAAAGDGLWTWHAGYLSPEGNYVSIDQTVVAVAGTTGNLAAWLSARTSNGQAEGTLLAAGQTWQKLSSRDTVQRSLVLRGPVSRGPVSTGPVSRGPVSRGPVSRGPVSRGAGTDGLVTVLSGSAPYIQLTQFAEALRPVPAT